MTRRAQRLMLIAWLELLVGSAAAGPGALQDEPQARALYDRMIAAMREAGSLYYESEYRWVVDGKEIGHVTYRCWLKKPNHFRLEISPFGSDEVTAVIVGDGEHQWSYWPNGRPRYQWEESGKFAEEYEKNHLISYMKRPTPPGKHSIGHATEPVYAGMAMTILNPSNFFGYVDSLQPYIDGVRRIGTETIGTEEYDAIEVSVMDGQRRWFLWLSRKDHLPRKLREEIHVSNDFVVDETWSDVTVNGPMSADLFKWSPPADWVEWKFPNKEDGLLPPGTEAPDFELASIDGGTIRLSDYRGKFVWLFKWRVGCPPCREEIPDVQEFYAKYRDQGLVVLGVNTADEKEFVAEVLEQNGVTFPNILDTSPEADEAMGKYETIGGGAVPLTYLIDREGKVMDAWFGYETKWSAAKYEEIIPKMKLDD